MPKPSPAPQIEDASKYLTVVHTFPLNADLRLPADCRTLALWLACCTGKDVLRAMYHKPRSEGMIIVEVDREFERFEAVLGRHSWSEFLLAPTEEEAGKTSEVFFCTYNTNKSVRDGGWNCVNIEEHWFQGWRPENDTIKFPYPKTTFCNVPSEAKTSIPLCRPLPRLLFSAIASESPASVSPTTDRHAGQGASEWHVVAFAPVASNPASDAPNAVTTRQGSSTYAVRTSARPPASPPGPAPLPGLSRTRLTPLPGTYPRSETSQVPFRRRPGPDVLVRAPQAYDYRDEDAPMSSTAMALADHFGSAPGAAPVTNGGIPSGTDEGTEMHGADPARDPTRTNGEAAIVENPWDGYDAPRSDPPTRVKKRGDEKWICPVHGPTCTPKICKELGRLERDERWKKEEEERQEKWQEKKERKAQRKAQRKARGAAEEDDVSDQGLRSQAESPNPPLSSTTTRAPLLDTPPSAAANVCAATASSIPVVPTEGGFPTFAGTDWADPIVAAQASSGKSSVAGVDANASEAGGGEEVSKVKAGRNSGRGRGNRLRRPGRAMSRGRASEASDSASGTVQTSELEVEILAGGPGESWGDPNILW